MADPPFSCKTDTQEGEGEVRACPPQQQMLHPGHGELPLPAATATFTGGISNTKTHSLHFILIAPWPISDLPSRMSCHFIFICTLLQTPEHWLGSPATPDADLNEPSLSAPAVSECLTGNPLTSLLGLGAWTDK